MGTEPTPGQPTVTVPAGSGDEVRLAGEPPAIGRYRTLHRLGAGGMGIVYAAYDDALQRKVAVKVMRPRITDDRLAAADRLLREAQAMAKLSHPNVVPVFDTGMVGDDVYVAMEFIDGASLRQWLSQTQGRATWRVVVETFIHAARGLIAAHDAGVVHRDFKPDNVMVGYDGRVRVMDFGLARLTESGEPSGETTLREVSGAHPSSERLTQAGAVLGTPAYMAPEQVAGTEIDARADQYSFCVALYEALYGRRPFPKPRIGGPRAAAKRRVRPPPADAPGPRWLRRAVMRGLNSAPADRHASMRALVRALDPSGRNRRRRVIIGGAIAVVAVGVAGTWAWWARPAPEGCGTNPVASSWEERREPIHTAFEATDAPFAAVAWTRSTQTIDAYVDGWGRAHDMACARVADESVSVDRVRRCLDRTRQEFMATLEVFAAADRQVVARSITALSALENPGQCLELTRSGPEPPSEKVAAGVAALQVKLARLRAAGRSGKYERAVAIADEALVDAEGLGYPPMIAEALLWAGNANDGAGHYEVARGHLEQAVWKAGEAGDDDVLARAAAKLVYVVGVRLQRHERALDWFRHAESALDRLGAGGEREARLLDNIAGVHHSSGDSPAALLHYRRALEIRERLAEGDDLRVASTLNNLGNALRQAGDPAEAKVRIEQGLEIRRRVLGRDHPLVAGSLNNLGMVQERLGEPSPAESSYRDAIGIYERAVGPDYLPLATSLNNLAGVQFARDDLEGAATNLLRALEIRRRALGADSPSVAAALNNLGQLRAQQGKHEAARRHYEESVQILDSKWEPGHPKTVLPLSGLGLAQLELGDTAGAIENLERAVSVARSTTQSPGELARVTFALARAVQDSDPRRARALAEQARDELVDLGPDHAEAREAIETFLGEGSAPR